MKFFHRFLWALGSFSGTVKAVFNRNTPCSCQSVRFGFVRTTPRSLSSSLKIFLRERGAGTSSLTLKAKPLA